MMPADLRSVDVTAEDAEILEDIAVEMMRVDDDRAMKLLALSLKYKYARCVERTGVEWPELHVIAGGRADA